MKEEGRKDDAEKPPMDLLPSLALFEVARVLGKGTKKYGRFNWRNGLNIGRCIAAALRHIFQYLAGEDFDAETKMHHLACAGCEILFALQFCLEDRKDLDDRFDKSQVNDIKNLTKRKPHGICDINIQCEYCDATGRRSIGTGLLNTSIYTNGACSCGNPNCKGSGAV